MSRFLTWFDADSFFTHFCGQTNKRQIHWTLTLRPIVKNIKEKRTLLDDNNSFFNIIFFYFKLSFCHNNETFISTKHCHETFRRLIARRGLTSQFQFGSTQVIWAVKRPSADIGPVENYFICRVQIQKSLLVWGKWSSSLSEVYFQLFILVECARFRPKWTKARIVFI